MNMVILNGRLCTIPKITFITINGENICCCKFVVAVEDSQISLSDSSDKYCRTDFFECIAFDQTAKMIGDNFVKGSKIVLSGKMKNFIFKDSNNTVHCTDIVLVNTVEFGDTSSALNGLTSANGKLDTSITSDLRQMDRHFKDICDKGFLCIDEDDYYNIANKIYGI